MFQRLRAFAALVELTPTWHLKFCVTLVPGDLLASAYTRYTKKCTCVHEGKHSYVKKKFFKKRIFIFSV